MDLTICPKFERAINLISQRWTGLIIYVLLEGPRRFCQIESAIGISGRVLSQRLKELEDEMSKLKLELAKLNEDKERSKKEHGYSVV